MKPECNFTCEKVVGKSTAQDLELKPAKKVAESPPGASLRKCLGQLAQHFGGSTENMDAHSHQRMTRITEI